MSDGEGVSAVDEILRGRPPDDALDWAVHTIGSRARLLSVEPLMGGRSHANHLLRVADQPAGVLEVVLRRWVRPDWRESDPQFSPEQEAATLGLLASSEVSAPQLLGADPAAGHCDVPAILMTRSSGEPATRPSDMSSFVRQLAGALPAIHDVDPAKARSTVPIYRPYYDRDDLRPPAWSQTPTVWERAIEQATRDAPSSQACFIHRDYHLGNTLWIGDRLSSIVDWTTASFGSPSVDISHMRANLAMSDGLATAAAFLAAWSETVGSSAAWHPYWDLQVALDFLPDLPRVTLPGTSLERLEDFVRGALASIG